VRRRAGLEMTESAVRVAVHRLRRRYRELLRAEIAQTLSHPEQVEERCGPMAHLPTLSIGSPAKRRLLNLAAEFSRNNVGERRRVGLVRTCEQKPMPT